VGAAHVIIGSFADWVSAIAALPGSGPLPVRTAIVPSERHGHGLRRELLRSGRGKVLGGTRFVGPETLAREILEEAERDFTVGEDVLRPARVLALLEEELSLEYFALDLLRSTPGWPEAIARAVGDLEGAGLAPDDIPTATPQWRDIALLWEKLDAAAGRSFTSARLFREAAHLLQKGARPGTGPVFAAVTGWESAVQARFLRALPGVNLGIVAVRPLRDRHLERVATLYGEDARNALDAGAPPDTSTTERDILSRYLFAPPEILADPGRLTSQGPDGTVSMEEYSGIEAEVEAAAEWVAREVLERKTPLEEVAVLVPTHDPLAAMVASRIARLPWRDGAFPVHIAGGVPLPATAGGARALSLVRALRSFLPAESVAEVLPALRAKVGDREHLSSSEAVDVAWGVGTVGGSPARREGALEWPERAAAREDQLAAQVATLDPEAEKREGWKLRPELDRLRAALPALSALADLARLVVDERVLEEIAPAFLAFMERWLLDPGKGGAPVHALLRDDIVDVRADDVAATVRGADALGIIEDRILSRRLPTVRFGDPAVYVGTLGAAAGLQFQAVRILGLSEGALPSPAREDAVLPDRMREQASPLVTVSGDRVLAQLHAFDRAVRCARARLTLSVPHSDLQRSERETSSLLVEVGAALGRPDGTDRHVIPDLQSLARTSFGPARAAAAAFRDAHPLTTVQWLDRAGATCEVPPAWHVGPHLDLTRILDLRARVGLGPADGLLGAKGPFPVLPGLAAEHPLSASALETLLSCPLKFLFQRVMRWDEPAGAAAVRELDALTFGATFHEIAERFYAEHGAAFVAKSKGLQHWKKALREIADETFTALRASYPLVGRGVEEKERGRLLQDLETFLDYDWKLPLERFVAVEKAFDGLALDVGGTKLHVRGYIDRIDVEQEHTLVRDLKTGSDHPRIGDEEGPTPVRDIQLGLYGLVARRKATEWGLPRSFQVAYAYARSGEERAFRGDYTALETAARRWLAVAVGLLEGHSFPPTPREDDCTFCPFVPVCGAAVRERAVAAAGGSGGAVGAFFDLKVPLEAGE